MAALIDLLRSIYDRSADAVVATTGGGAPAVAYANPAFAALCGAPAGALIGRSPEAIWPAGLGDGVLACIEGARPVEAETVEIRDADRSRWVELTVRPLAEAGAALLLVITRDVTAHKTVEAALAAERALVRTLFEGWPDYIYVKDTALRFLRANDATAAIMGAASPADLVGRTDAEFFPADIAAEMFATERRLVETGRAVVGLEERMVTPDGADAWVSTTQLPLRDAQGVVVGLVGIGRDITERKTAERLKSEFVSTVSHELRTPLTSIAGSLGLLAGGVAGALPDKAQHLVAIARKNSERLVRLINDILDMEKIESGRMEFTLARTDLAALVEQVAEQNQAFAAAHGVAIALRPPPRRLMVEADPDRLSQVVTNLLSNACKFSPAGETVTVSLVEQGGNARLLVADEGPGIPASFRARLFQPFAQADVSDARRKGGTGLGLSIAKSIVERHGGCIGYDSEVGQGTVFHVDLPLTEPLIPGEDGPDAACLPAIPGTRPGAVPVLAEAV